MDFTNMSNGDLGLGIAILTAIGTAVNTVSSLIASTKKAETDRQAAKDKLEFDAKMAADKLAHDLKIQETLAKLQHCEDQHAVALSNIDSVSKRLIASDLSASDLRKEIRELSAQLRESDVDRAKQTGLIEALRQSLAMLRAMPPVLIDPTKPQPVVTTTVTTTTPAGIDLPPAP